MVSLPLSHWVKLCSSSLVSLVPFLTLSCTMRRRYMMRRRKRWPWHMNHFYRYDHSNSFVSFRLRLHLRYARIDGFASASATSGEPDGPLIRDNEHLFVEKRKQQNTRWHVCLKRDVASFWGKMRKQTPFKEGSIDEISGNPFRSLCCNFNQYFGKSNWKVGCNKLFEGLWGSPAAVSDAIGVMIEIENFISSSSSLFMTLGRV